LEKASDTTAVTHDYQTSGLPNLGL
jgi:hypothetical protein